MKFTIKDVAQKAGVSKTTVSRIINGNYSHAKEETRKKVLEVIAEMNYQPNSLARGLKQVKTNVIGILVSNLKNPFWTEVLEGVEDTCRKYGYQLMICNSNEDTQLERDSIRALQLRQVDGIVANPTVKEESYYSELVNNRYPVVLINRKLKNVDIDYVVMDNIQGASLAVEHLLNLGKKKIAIFIYSDQHVSPWMERLSGYKKTLLKNGFTEKDYIIHFVKQDPDSVKSSVIHYLKNSPKPDAIFSTNNMLTLDILDGIKESGMKVPEDISLISYDDTVWSKNIDPPLSTVNQPRYDMGKIAAEKLIELINSSDEIKPVSIVLEPNLIIRKSCGSNN
jgi:DNA-binding LacI/PurR family transcriptional regulator